MINQDDVKTITAIILALALIPAIPSVAQAVEVAPFAGHRYGGGFKDTNTAARFELADATSYGLLLDFDTEPNKQIEVFLSHQDTQLTTAGTFTGNPLFDLTIDYYHIGGLFMMLPEGERVRPFVSGTLGLTRMDPKRSDLTTENRFSLSLGGGAKFFLSRSLGLRFDVRGIYTMLNADTSVFCSGGCAIRVRSSGFVQTEVGAALMMRF
ncbi:MAG: outer membrane beta-barrel protein [Gallionella sp.]